MNRTTPSSSLVRTQAFQACSAGSNPAGVAKIYSPSSDGLFFIGTVEKTAERMLAGTREKVLHRISVKWGKHK